MIITETRKAIIELIEPYMNKELEFWCLIKTIHNYNEFIWWIYYTDCNKELTMWYINISDNMKSLKIEFSKNKDFKIIWHYDITAVQNLLESKTFAEYILTIEDWSIIFSEIIKFCECDIPEITRQIFKIPNKPLHLFSESEDIQLLKLLQYII
jgi:hypothetical protein